MRRVDVLVFVGGLNGFLTMFDGVEVCVFGTGVTQKIREAVGGLLK